MQTYTSKNTSINKNQIPRLFNSRFFVDFIANYERPTRMSHGQVFRLDKILLLDIGGGKYDNAKEAVEKSGEVDFNIYDKYNRDEEHNRDVLRKCVGRSDVVTCANVLNVIKEKSERLGVVELAKKSINDGGVAFFQVYIGNGKDANSCNSRQTKKDCWQNFFPVEDYMDEIGEHFDHVERVNNQTIKAW